MSSRSLSVALSLVVMAGACGGPDAPPAAPAVAPPVAADAGPSAAATTLEVRLLAFNDFHGHLKPPTNRVPKIDGPVGGAAYFATHLKRLAAGHPNTLIVAAGDLVGASPLTSALFHDEPTIAVMNEIGLGVTTIGNHELDEGMDELLRLKRGGCHPKDGCKFEKDFGGSKFDWLAANVTRGGEAPLPAYVIKVVGGVPVAFVGMPLEGTPRSVVPEGVAGLSFANEVKTANALVPEIKAKGASTIVLLVHEGGESRSPGLDECNDLKGAIVGISEKLDPAFKAIVSGHTHQLYNCKVAGRPVTSASSFGRVVTAIDMTIDATTKEATSVVAHNYAVTHDVPPDPAVQAIVDKAAAAAAPLENRVIGRIAGTLSGGGRNGQESTLGRVVADAQLEATKKVGAKLAFVNAAGIRSDIVFERSGEEKEDGLVTYGEAFAAQPFGNHLVTMTVTGAELTECLGRELRGAGVYVSDGFVVKWDKANKDTAPVLVLDGKPIKPTASVKITTNDFVADRDPTLATIKDRTPGVVDIDALEAYFARRKVVEPPKKSRIVKP